MDANAIGLFLLKLRKERSLTQKDIAKLCSVSTQAVSKWERGESIPDIELLDRLSMLYSLTINEIINGERKETFIDVDKRANIISLTMSILVFISYFFNYAEIRECNSSGIICNIFNYKGYELIFDGISGWQVYLSWFVFVLLISVLLLNIFIVSKIILKKGNVLRYFYGASIILILVSLFGIIHELFYAFPQFIILLSSIIILSLTLYSGESVVFVHKLKTYNKLRKESKIPAELMLSDELKQTRLYKTLKILIVGISVIYLLGFLFILIGYIVEFESHDTIKQKIMLSSALSFLSLGLIVLWSYKYIGSIYTNRFLQLDALLSVPLLFISFLVFRFGLGTLILLAMFIGLEVITFKFSKKIKLYE